MKIPQKALDVIAQQLPGYRGVPPVSLPRARAAPEATQPDRAVLAEKYSSGTASVPREDDES